MVLIKAARRDVESAILYRIALDLQVGELAAIARRLLELQIEGQGRIPAPLVVADA